VFFKEKMTFLLVKDKGSYTGAFLVIFPYVLVLPVLTDSTTFNGRYLNYLFEVELKLFLTTL
jgi:hypothetical protein